MLTGAVSPPLQREITRKLTFPKQPTNPFLEMVKFLLERIAPVHIDSEAIRSEKQKILLLVSKKLHGQLRLTSQKKNVRHVLIVTQTKEVQATNFYVPTFLA